MRSHAIACDRVDDSLISWKYIGNKKRDWKFAQSVSSTTVNRFIIIIFFDFLKKKEMRSGTHFSHQTCFFLKTVFKSSRTQVAQGPTPSMHMTLFLGWDLVPQKFLGECGIMMFPFKSAAKITVSISLTNARSFALFESPELKMSLKAWRFLFPASLLSLWINQSAPEERVCMFIFVYVFRTTL